MDTQNVANEIKYVIYFWYLMGKKFIYFFLKRKRSWLEDQTKHTSQRPTSQNDCIFV